MLSVTGAGTGTGLGQGLDRAWTDRAQGPGPVSRKGTKQEIQPFNGHLRRARRPLGESWEWLGLGTEQPGDGRRVVGWAG